jgi:hypothetical protein
MQCTLHRKGSSEAFLKSLTMKDLNEALTEITAIRRQTVRTAEFLGYGPVTVAITGLMAFAAAEVQARTVPGGCVRCRYLSCALDLDGRDRDKPNRFEMVIRSRTIHSSLAQEMILHAVEQLVPSGVAEAARDGGDHQGHS